MFLILPKSTDIGGFEDVNCLQSLRLSLASLVTAKENEEILRFFVSYIFLDFFQMESRINRMKLVPFPKKSALSRGDILF